MRQVQGRRQSCSIPGWAGGPIRLMQMQAGGRIRRCPHTAPRVPAWQPPLLLIPHSSLQTVCAEAQKDAAGGCQPDDMTAAVRSWLAHELTKSLQGLIWQPANAADPFLEPVSECSRRGQSCNKHIPVDGYLQDGA